MSIDIKKNKPLLIAGWILLVYSILEIMDCITMVLIGVGLNIIPSDLYQQAATMLFPMFYDMTKSVAPLLLALFFFIFTLMRFIAAIGVLRNRLWGFFIGIIDLLLTMIIAMLFIPVGILEMFGCSIILILLLIGRFGDQPIIKER